MGMQNNKENWMGVHGESESKHQCRMGHNLASPPQKTSRTCNASKSPSILGATDEISNMMAKEPTPSREPVEVQSRNPWIRPISPQNPRTPRPRKEVDANSHLDQEEGSKQSHPPVASCQSLQLEWWEQSAETQQNLQEAQHNLLEFLNNPSSPGELLRNTS